MRYGISIRKGNTYFQEIVDAIEPIMAIEKAMENERNEVKPDLKIGEAITIKVTRV